MNNSLYQNSKPCCAFQKQDELVLGNYLAIAALSRDPPKQETGSDWEIGGKMGAWDSQYGTINWRIQPHIFIIY